MPLLYKNRRGYFFCYDTGMKWVIGIDEVGRGPLAGPVYVCAVAMPQAQYKKMNSGRGMAWQKPTMLKDSKQMTAANRELWHIQARAMEKAGLIKIAVASRAAAMIDRQGIAVCIRACIASNLQMLGLDPKDCIVLLDGGLKAPAQYKNQQTIIRGDDSQKIISLASVVAKVSRDRYMMTLHKKHPSYMWSSNKGYGTRAHTSVIQKEGITPFHRKSFLRKFI